VQLLQNIESVHPRRLGALSGHQSLEQHVFVIWVLLAAVVRSMDRGGGEREGGREGSREGSVELAGSEEAQEEAKAVDGAEGQDGWRWNGSVQVNACVGLNLLRVGYFPHGPSLLYINLH
jgi:hypothetical protein